MDNAFLNKKPLRATSGLLTVRPYYQVAIFIFFLIQTIIINMHSVSGQTPDVNYDEAKVGEYILPDPLIAPSGKKITTVHAWEKEQRPAILQQFADHVYGRIPEKTAGLRFKVTSTDAMALGGKATRKQITVYFTSDTNSPSMQILLYLPNSIKTQVPIFIGLNFEGNHTILYDTGIEVTKSWLRINTGSSAEKTRGAQSSSWQVEELISNGYGLATVYYQDLEADHKDGWKTGIRTTLSKELKIEKDEWSAIAAWAWGLSRMMDYLETDSRVNSKKIIITGHSRLGKAALWAAANDRRFAIVISNNSGEGGAALSKRNFGETIKIINTSFPHWFVPAYKKYNTNPGALPVDQHMLLALMAPRPLYVASASKDLWADPKGEFLGAKHAEPVYRLYNKEGLGVLEMPAIDRPVGNTIGYHIRTGEHDITPYDWQQYIKFADEHLGK